MEVKISKSFLIVLGTVVGGLLCLYFLRNIEPFHWIFYSMYRNPISWIVFAIFIVLSVLVGFAVEDEWAHRKILIWLLVSTIIFGIYWLIIKSPVMMIGLGKVTKYELVDYLPAVEKIRPVSYSEASYNFDREVPTSNMSPGDLDYVRGYWVSEWGPSAFFSKYSRPTRGIFMYDPQSEDSVRIIRGEFPFSERGILGNNLDLAVYRVAGTFVEFHEVLYIQEDNQLFGVISLIKRTGWRRVPYVHSILIFDSNGYFEPLSVRQAIEDPRLAGVQLTPEWLSKLKVQSYGWDRGLWRGLFLREGRVDVSSSNINEENSAPYHVETTEGNVWMTPFSPLNKTSIIGIAYESSHNPTGSMKIWSLEENEAMRDVDAMAATIWGSSEYSDLQWNRVSKVEGGSVSTGVVSVIEMIPVPRKEGDNVIPYFMGYISNDPPTNTKFYVVVNPINNTVYKKIVGEMQFESWLRGEFEIELASDWASDSSVSPKFDSDTTSMSDQDLFDLIKEILDELEQRQK